MFCQQYSYSISYSLRLFPPTLTYNKKIIDNCVDSFWMLLCYDSIRTTAIPTCVYPFIKCSVYYISVECWSDMNEIVQTSFNLNLLLAISTLIQLLLISIWLCICIYGIKSIKSKYIRDCCFRFGATLSTAYVHKQTDLCMYDIVKRRPYTKYKCLWAYVCMHSTLLLSIR